MRSPIWWFGGKGKMTAKLLPYLTSHHTYVEPFGGGASLLFAKEPSKVEVYNDLDSGLVNFFRVLRDPERFKKLHRLISLTPYSRQEYNEARERWKAEDWKDDIERAWLFWVLARQSFGGRLYYGWGMVITATRRGMAGTTSMYLSTIENLSAIHERLFKVQIEHKPAVEVIKQYDTPETLFYCDPPYPTKSRKNGGYLHEMTDDDHRELRDVLLNVQGKVLLSSYQNDLYQPLSVAGWQKVEWQTACFAAGRTRGTGILGDGAAKRMQPRTECLWVSPNHVNNERLRFA